MPCSSTTARPFGVPAGATSMYAIRTGWPYIENGSVWTGYGYGTSSSVGLNAFASAGAFMTAGAGVCAAEDVATADANSAVAASTQALQFINPFIIAPAGYFNCAILPPGAD